MLYQDKKFKGLFGDFLEVLTGSDPMADLTNPFFRTQLLKSRIDMLYKTRNSNWVLAKYLAVVVLVGFMAGSMAFKPPLVTQVPGQIAKTIKVKGVVVDTDNKPLPDLLVKVAGANMVFLTDQWGQYEATIPVDSDLVFSSKSHKEISVKVKGDQVINAVLAKTGAPDSSAVHAYPWIREKRRSNDEINLGQLIPRYAPEKAQPKPDTLHTRFRFLGDIDR